MEWELTMDMEGQVRDAMLAELQRQAEESGGSVAVSSQDEGRVRVHGVIDLEALAMAVVGSVAGGP